MKSKSVWIIASAFCIVMFAAIFGMSHTDSLMVLGGNFYYGKNDINMAQKFYESAFDMGVTDKTARENYVNSIINSPLTIKAQEKLVKFINYPVEDNVKLKAEYFLYDIKREIFRKYEGNYISKAPYNGKIIHWGKLPITYGFITQEEIPEYYEKQIEAAFKTWEKALNQMIYFERNDQNPDVIISFISNTSANEDDKKYVAAYTAPKTSVDNRLENAQINFYLKDVEDKYFSENQIYNNALHEIVHALGFMGHSDNKKDVMYMSKDYKTLQNDKMMDLTQGDINTMKLLYIIKPDITNSEEIKSEYIPYVVLGDNTEVTNSKIRDAKAYIGRAPNIPNGYIDLATGYVAAHDYAKAIKNLQKALELADNNDILEIIYYNLAVSYYNIGSFESAKENVKKSISIKDSEDKRFLLAQIYEKENDIVNAINEYYYLINNYSPNIEYTIALTNIYIKKREYLQARQVLKSYFNANPGDKKNPRLAPYGIVRLGL